MRLSLLATALLGDVLVFAPSLVAASDPLWLQPSTQWYGIDGNWSAFSFLVGSPPQSVDLLPSTSLSEIWVIESTACSPNTLCSNAHGGVFDYHSSRSWQSLGAFQLGLSWLGLGGNGDYGLETIAMTNDYDGSTTTVAVDKALIAGINNTGYYQGFLGIGCTEGNFSNVIAYPYISQLAETYGTIPSHSYGFTAGAYYMSPGGMPASLTLGGYDSLRFQPHNIIFDLDPNVRIPTVTLRGITVCATYQQAVSAGWTTQQRSLATMDDFPNPVILDSSTPFLWLPTSVCTEFESALNITWNETLGVYLYPDGPEYTKFLQNSPFEFTFSLSSYDNKDNYGEPLDVAGVVVNITVTAAAFAQVLRYPFESISDPSQPAIPYFPLRRVDNGTIIIGRVFMQEAYMIMNYDLGQFSVHQALFPQNPTSNYSLQGIDRPPSSPYPAYVSPSMGLSTPKAVGIGIASFAVGSAVMLTLWCCCRKRRSRKNSDDPEEEIKDFESTTEAEEPTSPVSRILSKITRRKKSRKPKVHEVAGNTVQPVEVGADANHERYELPVPPEPVELDCNDDAADDVTQLGTEDTEGLSPYEIARRKLERQLMGPVPTYSPPTTGSTLGANGKTEQDVSPVAHHRPADTPSPVEPSSGNNSNSLPNTLPSPMSPHGEWPLRPFDLPSPSSVIPPMPSPQSLHFPSSASNPSSTSSVQSPRSVGPPSPSQSNSPNVSPQSPVGSLLPPSPSYQRTPIDPSRVICLGPLPENVQLPHHRPSIPRLITPDGRTVAPSVSPEPGPAGQDGDRRRLSDTLGSNFTVDEESRIREEMTRQQSERIAAEGGGDSPASAHPSRSPRSPHSMERIDPGSELIHVPQLADRRYSWEEVTHDI